MVNLNSITTDMLHDQLEARYSGDAWAYFSELPDGTGSAQSRTADGFAMSLWPSRGLEIYGFEIKRTRTDWLKELKSPEKAEAIAKFCDRWYVVTPKGLIKEHELPPTWGLLESTGKQLKIKVKAPKLNPVQIDRPFLAAILRKASAEPDKHYRRGHDKGYQQGLENGKEWNASDLKRAEENLQKIEKNIRDFEKKSGISLGKWSDGKQLGTAVRTLMSNKTMQLAKIERTIELMKSEAAHLTTIKKELETL